MTEAESDTVRVWVARLVGVVVLVGMAAGGWQVLQIRADARAMAGLDRAMRALAVAMQEYARDAPDGFYPPLSGVPGVTFMEGASIYPRYLDDPAMAVSPRRPDAGAALRGLRTAPEDENGHIDPGVVEAVGAQSFHYLGYAVENEVVGRAFLRAYRAAAEASMDFRAGNLTVHFPEEFAGPRVPMHGPPGARWESFGPGNAGSNTIWRLREGIASRIEEELGVGHVGRMLTAGDFPVLIERPAAPGASIRVVYLDGRIALMPFGEFPNTGEFVEGLAALGGVIGSPGG